MSEACTLRLGPIPSLAALSMFILSFVRFNLNILLIYFCYFELWLEHV